MTSQTEPPRQNDPHVAALHYTLTHDDGVEFSKAVPLECETADFKVRVDGNKALFTMKTHYADVAAARAVVEDFTRAWRIHAHLKDGHLIEFAFEHPDIVDRAAKPGDVRLYAHGASIRLEGGNAKLTVSRQNYPQPPTAFATSVDVEAMHARYLKYRVGGEPLPSMAYWCLTYIEESAGSRKKAAAKYCIDPKMLSRLGELVSEKGGAEARKSKGANTPYSSEEREWIDAAVKSLIRRLGEAAHNPTGPHPLITSTTL